MGQPGLEQHAPLRRGNDRTIGDTWERRKARQMTRFVRVGAVSGQMLRWRIDGMRNLDRTWLVFLVISQLVGCSYSAVDSRGGFAQADAATANTSERPLIIAEAAGEVRYWRQLTGLPAQRTLSSFTIKIDEKMEDRPLFGSGPRACRSAQQYECTGISTKTRYCTSDRASHTCG